MVNIRSDLIDVETLNARKTNHSYPLGSASVQSSPLEAGRLLLLGDTLLGTRIIEILQSIFPPEWNWIFLAITLLGDETLLIGLSAAVYWCFDKRRGRSVTYILLIGAYVNFFLKTLIPWPRPPVDLRIVEKNEMSYGFPSGHAQDSATFWAWVSLDFRKRSLAFVGTAIVGAVGISRVYLGVHYPIQVIGGWVIGLSMVLVGTMILRHLSPRTEDTALAHQTLLAVMILGPLFATALFGDPSEFNAGRIGGYLFGFWFGTLAEVRYVKFTTEVGRVQRILRILIGGGIGGLFAFGLGVVFPSMSLIPSFVNSVIQGLTVALVIPALFTIIERGRV